MSGGPLSVSQNLNSLVKWQEHYTSHGLNRKFSGILQPGIYKGFVVSAIGGRNLLVNHDDSFPSSVAVIERDGYSITVRMDNPITFTVPDGLTGEWFLVLEAYYTINQNTTQSVKLTKTLESHHVTLARLKLPDNDGAAEIIHEMIDTESDGSRDDSRKEAGLLAEVFDFLFQLNLKLSVMDERLSRVVRYLKTTTDFDENELYPIVPEDGPDGEDDKEGEEGVSGDQ